MVSSQQSSGSIFCQSKKSHFDPFYRLFGTSVNSDLADIYKTHLVWETFAQKLYQRPGWLYCVLLLWIVGAN